jgi:hypothetical protein
LRREETNRLAVEAEVAQVVVPDRSAAVVRPSVEKGEGFVPKPSIGLEVEHHRAEI